jgi:FkbM family methyltransferase
MIRLDKNSLSRLKNCEHRLVVNKNKLFMDKAELLRKLDIAAEFSNKLSEFRKLLGDSDKVQVIFTETEVRIYQVETGAYFIWDISDPRTAVACLAISGEYEPRETSLICKITKHCKIVIDVGANVGYYAINIPLMSPNVQNLYAFEPLLEAYEQLRKNILINGLGARVFPINRAISDENMELELFIPEVFGTSATSSVQLHPEVVNMSVIVKAVSLNEMYDEGVITGCDFLKIDVEGAEKFVLEGSMSMLEREKPVILAEILRKWSQAQGYDANEIILLLKSIGYRCFAVGESLSEVFNMSDDLEETNFLFLNSGNESHKLIALEIGLAK